MRVVRASFLIAARVGHRHCIKLECFHQLRIRRAIARKNRNLVGHGLFRVGRFSGQYHKPLGDGIPSSRKWDANWPTCTGALTVGSNECYEFTKFADVQLCDVLFVKEFVGRFNESARGSPIPPAKSRVES